MTIGKPFGDAKKVSTRSITGASPAARARRGSLVTRLRVRVRVRVRNVGVRNVGVRNVGVRNVGVRNVGRNEKECWGILGLEFIVTLAAGPGQGEGFESFAEREG